MTTNYRSNNVQRPLTRKNTERRRNKGTRGRKGGETEKRETKEGGEGRREGGRKNQI